MCVCVCVCFLLVASRRDSARVRTNATNTNFSSTAHWMITLAKIDHKWVLSSKRTLPAFWGRPAARRSRNETRVRKRGERLSGRKRNGTNTHPSCWNSATTKVTRRSSLHSGGRIQQKHGLPPLPLPPTDEPRRVSPPPSSKLAHDCFAAEFNHHSLDLIACASPGGETLGVGKKGHEPAAYAHCVSVSPWTSRHARMGSRSRSHPLHPPVPSLPRSLAPSFRAPSRHRSPSPPSLLRIK